MQNQDWHQLGDKVCMRLQYADMSADVYADMYMTLVLQRPAYVCRHPTLNCTPDTTLASKPQPLGPVGLACRFPTVYGWRMSPGAVSQLLLQTPLQTIHHAVDSAKRERRASA